MGTTRIPSYAFRSPHAQLRTRGHACLPGRMQGEQLAAAFRSGTHFPETVVENGIRTRVLRWAEHFRLAGKMTVACGMRDEEVTRDG